MKTTAREDNMNIIVKVTRPELTPEERAKRMKTIKKAATNLVIAQMKGAPKCGPYPNLG